MDDKVINVTKSFLPDKSDFVAYLDTIWSSKNITNQGPLVKQLENKLKDYLGVKHLFFVNNGTIALQIAIKALNISKDIITTPFSYVATTSSIVWENCNPVFADIEEGSLCISPDKIIKAITPDTQAIMATHVYGYPCKVEVIEEIAKKHRLKVIYDAAHAFGVNYKGTSVLNYGDISTLSFHATKIFHTGEGGAIVTNDDELAGKIAYMRNFGHNGTEAFFGVGINGKNSELHAAMGLAILPHIDVLIYQRKSIWEKYNKILGSLPLRIPGDPDSTMYNYSYYPVIFKSETKLLEVQKALNAKNIFPRRYFYPSLNTLNYVVKQNMPLAEQISSRILCLPLFYDLSDAELEKITTIIKDCF